MPVIWKYLIVNFLRIFGLSVGAFLAILIASRLEEVAHFASLGAPISLIALFALFQVPYILPIAIPISCLISGVLLMKQLSSDQELTAIRAAGFSLKEVAFPILLTAFALSLVNFYCVSEVATFSHYQANLLKNELRSVNPLLLLRNKHLLKTKGMYFDALGASKLGQSASDILLAIPEQKPKTLQLIVAKNLSVQPDEISAKGLSFFTPFGKMARDQYDQLLIENISSGTIPLKDFAELIEKKTIKITPDSLSLNAVITILQDKREQTHRPNITPLEKKELVDSIRTLISEIARRFSLGFAPVTLTLLGLSFGVSISRKPSTMTLFFPIALTALFLTTFFAAKAMEQKSGLAIALYAFPQLLIILASVFKMWRISHGKGT